MNADTDGEDGYQGENANLGYPLSEDIVEEGINHRGSKNDEYDEEQCGTGKFCSKGRHVHRPSDGVENCHTKNSKYRHPGPDVGQVQQSISDELKHSRGKAHQSSSDEIFKPRRNTKSTSDEIDQYTKRKNYSTDSTETEGPYQRKPRRYLSVEDAYYSEQIQVDMYECPAPKSQAGSSEGKNNNRSISKGTHKSGSDTDDNIHINSREQTMDEDSDDAFMQMINERRRRRKNSKDKKRRK
jgi:hypothetical protein